MKRAETWLAAATLLLHLAVAGRYDFFRDELYFIVCGRHPAFGYVDQPPGVPLLAAATQLFGERLWLLRALPAGAAAATVWVTCALARLAGARGFGVIAAGLAAALAPMYLGVQTTLGTSSFEPLAWTCVAWLIARAVVDGDGRAWWWAGVAVGLDLELKYELPVWLLPIFLALILTGQARRLWRREVLVGAVLATALAAPSLVWQLAHGLPFLELVHNQAARGKNLALSPGQFVLQQAMVMNPLFAAFALLGVIAPFVDERLRRVRFLSVAFVLTFALLCALKAKDYYLAPAYGAMFAVAGAAFERGVTVLAPQLLWASCATVLSAMAAPQAMPILDPEALVAYQRALHLQARSGERLRQSELPQTFADMIGWRSYVKEVARAVAALPADERARVAIFTDNYGEAAALDFFGTKEGLPPALSGHNQYWLWGTRGHDGSVLLRVNEEPASLQPRCREVALVGRFGTRHAMPYETVAPLTLCRGLQPSLETLWPSLKFYY